MQSVRKLSLFSMTAVIKIGGIDAGTQKVSPNIRFDGSRPTCTTRCPAFDTGRCLLTGNNKITDQTPVGLSGDDAEAREQYYKDNPDFFCDVILAPPEVVAEDIPIPPGFLES